MNIFLLYASTQSAGVLEMIAQHCASSLLSIIPALQDLLDDTQYQVLSLLYSPFLSPLPSSYFSLLSFLSAPSSPLLSSSFLFPPSSPLLSSCCPLTSFVLSSSCLLSLFFSITYSRPYFSMPSIINSFGTLFLPAIFENERARQQ